MKSKSMAQRLAEHTDASDPDGCWIWGGYKDRDGYGRSGSQMAHRRLYVEFVGPIEPGMEVDHACRTRACVNPKHLEVVTRAENNRRMHEANKEKRFGVKRGADRTHCTHGHEFTEANTRRTARGSQICRRCINDASARYQARKAAALTTNPAAAATRAELTTAEQED